MALCWGQHFRSCSLSAVFGRRAPKPVSLRKKPGIASAPLLHQLTVREPCQTDGHELISRLSTSSMFYTQECKAYKEVPNEPDNYSGRPEKSQLKRVSQILANDLPRLFSKTINYNIYHPNIVLENNIRGIRTVGLMNCMIELLIIRFIAHFKFSYLTLKILKITEHIEDGTVRVRWRAEGIPLYTVFFRPFKTVQSAPKINWYDGFSTYYVHSDGLVHKLTVDKMMPDSEEKVSSSLKSELAAKVAFAIGVSLKDLSSQLVCTQAVKRHSKVFNPEYPLHVNRTVQRVF